MNLTLFDLDGTLIPKDSDHAFGEFVVSLGWADEGEFRQRNDAFYEDYLAGRLDIDAYVDFATAPWRDRTPAELARATAHFIDTVVRPMVPAAALELVRGHQRTGDLVAIVTATNDFVTRPIARLLGVDELIATELARDARGQVDRHDPRRAGVPRRQDRAGSAVAGRKGPQPRRLHAQHLLQRFHQRPAAARVRQPRRWPPTPVRRWRASRASAAGLS